MGLFTIKFGASKSICYFLKKRAFARKREKIKEKSEVRWNLRFDKLLGFYNQNLDFLPQSKQTMTVSLPAGIIIKITFNTARMGSANIAPTSALAPKEFPLITDMAIMTNKVIKRMSVLRDCLSFLIVCICTFCDPQ
jgi:hypothetical protein